jgi:hypothetical protein
MTLQKIKNGWALFKEAVVGDGEIDYTEGSIGRVTVMLAIPLERKIRMLLHSLRDRLFGLDRECLL